MKEKEAENGKWERTCISGRKRNRREGWKEQEEGKERRSRRKRKEERKIRLMGKGKRKYK